LRGGAHAWSAISSGRLGMLEAMPVSTPSIVPSGRHVELPGRGTTFVREMNGPPGAPTVVLLHGLSATGGLNWLWCFGALGQHYRVAAVDHRGHGRGIPTRRFRLADCADDVAALADRLGVEKVVAVGYSMGGPIAQLLWHRHRDRVGGLVLCATSGYFGGNQRQQALLAGLLPGLTVLARSMPAPARRVMVSRLLEARLPEFPARDWVIDEMRRSDVAAVTEAAAALSRFSSREWIGDVDVPAAVVVTELDGIVPPARQHRLAAAIPGATVHPLAGDHDVCVARPKLFVPVLLDACRSVTTRARAAPRR
jgi:3-oxoadipate enol-lactonase